MDRARRDAAATIASLDLSRRDLVLWLPGTGSTRMYGPFESAVRATWNDNTASLAVMPYEASWNLRCSVPTGIMTLRLVLEEIARRGGNHRIHLAGVSQGSWIIGEAMADPALRRLVHRAVLAGHPSFALHKYTSRTDPGIEVVNHMEDPVAHPLKGDPTATLDAVIGANLLKPAAIPGIISTVLGNPQQLARLGVALLSQVPLLKAIAPNPHDYGAEMPAIASWLRHGSAI